MNQVANRGRKSPGSVVQVWVYSRVSTEEQAQGGISLDMQEEMAEQWCREKIAGRPYELTKVRDEGASGKYGWKPLPQSSRVREGLARVVEAIEAGQVDKLLIYRIDRLARNLLVWEEFLQRYVYTGKVELVILAENVDFSTPGGRALAGILSTFSSFQREQTAENIRNTIQRQTGKGYPWGTVGYGWRRKTKAERQPGEPSMVHPVPEELEQVKRIIAWFRAGWGERRIARQLQREGVPPPNGARRWRRGNVRAILRNPLHAGLVRHQDSFVRGVHYEHRIIEPDEYYEILGEMKRRRAERRKRTDDKLFPLWKVARCLKCNSLIQGFIASRYGTRFYRCRGSDFDEGETCPGWQKHADLVERVVLKHITAFAARPEFQEMLEEAARQEVMEAEADQLRRRQARLEKALKDLRRQRQKLLNAYVSGRCAEEDYNREYERIQVDIAAVDEELQQVRRLLEDENRREQVLEEVKEAVRQLPALWRAMNAEERRHLLDSMLEYIYIGPAEGKKFEVRMKIHFLPEVAEAVPSARSRASGLFDDVEHLTPRELAVLYWLREGKSVDEIAEMWGTTREALHYLMRSIKRRLGVDNMEEAIALAAHRLDAEKERLPLGPTGWHVGRPRSCSGFTPRMKQVLEDYIEGLSEEECARRRGIKAKTVSVYRWKIRDWFGVKTLDEAAQLYLASEGVVRRGHLAKSGRG